MKTILTILITLATFNLFAADLTLGNSETRTISSDATYDNIILNKDAVLNILSGVTVTATNLEAKNSATINLDGVLNITGNMDIKNSGTLTVNNTGTMDVGGDVTAFNGSSLELDGDVQIDGDLNADKATITVDGTVNVDGTFTGTVDSGTGTLTSGNNNNYNNPLPVELLFATANAEKEKINLNWTTAAEINNDYFTVLLSTNMKSWEEVAQIDGNGNSSRANEYNYNFIPKANGEVYIRLQQTDFDGTTEILKVFALKLNEASYSIYPQPAKAGQAWHISGINSTDIIQVYNSGMQPVKDTKNLSRGFYYVVINNNHIEKLIVR